MTYNRKELLETATTITAAIISTGRLTDEEKDQLPEMAIEWAKRLIDLSKVAVGETW